MNGRAKEYQALRHRMFPVTIGTRRVEGLFTYLIPALPKSVVRRHKSGQLAVYGVSAPDVAVHTEPVSSDDDVVEMSVNFMQFLYACIRTLCGNARLVRTPEDCDPATLSIDELAHHMDSLLKSWKSGEVFGENPYKYEQFHLHPSQIEIAETLTLFAELFALAHEIGHVVVRHRLEKVLFPSGLPDGQAEELWADGFATRCVLRVSPRSNIRYAWAGSLISLRLFDWLERMGCIRHPAYPPAARRVSHIKDVCREWFADPEEFTSCFTIAEAYDRQFEVVESRLLGTTLPAPAAERLLISLLAVAEEYVVGRLRADEFPSKVAQIVKDVPKPVLDELAAIVCRRVLRFVSRVQVGDPIVMQDPFAEAAFGALLSVLKDYLNITEVLQSELKRV